MKTLKNSLTIIALLFLTVMVACKKDKNDVPDIGDPNNPDSPVNTVSANHLESYYMVGETNGNKKLFIIYFSKEANVLKANMHQTGALRISNAVVANSKFTFDFDANGTNVYNFEFEEDATGLIKLKNYALTGNNSGALKLDHAILVKKSDAPVFTNSSFKVSDILFRLNASNAIEWDIKIRQIGTKVVNGQPFPIMGTLPEVTKQFYSLNNLGFKSNDDEFFGISVPNWKNSTTPILLIERAGAVTVAIKQ